MPVPAAEPTAPGVTEGVIDGDGMVDEAVDDPSSSALNVTSADERGVGKQRRGLVVSAEDKRALFKVDVSETSGGRKAGDAAGGAAIFPNGTTSAGIGEGVFCVSSSSFSTSARYSWSYSNIASNTASSFCCWLSGISSLFLFFIFASCSRSASSCSSSSSNIPGSSSSSLPLSFCCGE